MKHYELRRQVLVDSTVHSSSACPGSISSRDSIVEDCGARSSSELRRLHSQDVQSFETENGHTRTDYPD